VRGRESKEVKNRGKNKETKKPNQPTKQKFQRDKLVEIVY
jgi:hypothetical protein